MEDKINRRFKIQETVTKTYVAYLDVDDSMFEDEDDRDDFNHDPEAWVRDNYLRVQDSYNWEYLDSDLVDVEIEEY